MRTILKVFSLCCASALFTQPLQAEKLNPVTTAAISCSLRQFTQGIRTGKIVVDSSAVSTDSVKIFLNTALQDVPMRSDNVSEILKTVSGCLPDELRQRQLSLYVNGHDIHSLIPNYFKTKADRRKAFYNVPAEYTGKNAYTPFTPIVTNLDRPYSVKNGLQGKHIAM